jgi:hypothetical protein
MTELILEYDGLMNLPASKIRLSTDEARAFIPILHEVGQMINPEQLWFWSEEWQVGERQVDDYIRAGNYEVFDTMEEFLRTLGE